MVRRKRRTTSSKALIIHPNRDDVTRDQMNRYQAILKSQAELTEVIKKFTQRDRPSFESWMKSTFETIYTEIESKLDELTDIREQMDAIGHYADRMNVTTKASAKIVFDVRKQGREALHSFMDELNIDFDESEPEIDFAPVETKVHLGTIADYFKNIYHTCVRLIHPDTVAAQSFDSELWQDLQTAYASKDFQKLERLRDRITDSETPREAQTPGELCDLRILVQKQIKELKTQIAQAKHEPSWLFTDKSENPKQLKKFFRKIEADLIEDLTTLAFQVKYARLELDRL